MPPRKSRDLSHDEVITLLKARDPDFAREWDQGTPARLVASELMGYRYDHNLTQAQLAELVGVKQPQIARWEVGDSLPTPSNLARLAGKLKLEFVFSYTPADVKPKLMTKSAAEDERSYEEHDCIVRIAAISRQ
jgi:DNA-binding XRE family transcriptional regulator